MSRPEIAPPTPIEALPGPAIRVVRGRAADGLSRRSLLRMGLGAGIAVWVTELLGGTIAFLWSAIALDPPVVRVGTLGELIAANPGVPVRDGFPAYVPAARAFVVLVDPTLAAWQPGSDATGDGTVLNVRALSQRCPHLGCRPNPCLDDYWFHCPCHQSRYDRLGIKAAGERYGPAQRSMDRFATTVDSHGILTIDTGHITLGPLPVALGLPGLIPPLVQNGCV